MTLIIELTHDQESRLTAASQQTGLAPAELAHKLVADHLPAATLEKQANPAMTPRQRAIAFRTWAESHSRGGPLLSDEAISRESMYGERG